jgi:hypothetical protein
MLTLAGLQGVSPVQRQWSLAIHAWWLTWGGGAAGGVTNVSMGSAHPVLFWATGNLGVVGVIFSPHLSRHQPGELGQVFDPIYFKGGGRALGAFVANINSGIV